MEVLDRLLRKLKRRGHRVVLFSQVSGLRLEIEMSQATGSRAGWRPLLRPLDIAGGPNLALLVRCCHLQPRSPVPCSSTVSWISSRITCLCGATSEGEGGWVFTVAGGCMLCAVCLELVWMPSVRCGIACLSQTCGCCCCLSCARRYSRLDGSTNRVQRMIDIKVGGGACQALVGRHWGACRQPPPASHLEPLLPACHHLPPA